MHHCLKGMDAPAFIQWDSDKEEGCECHLPNNTQIINLRLPVDEAGDKQVGSSSTSLGQSSLPPTE